MSSCRIVLLAAASAALLCACSTTRNTPSGGGTSASGSTISTPSGSFSPSTTEPGSTPKVETPARGANRPYTVLGQSYTPVTGDKPMRQTGIASWYGKQFHGKKTSNGEIFDMYSVSAAHKTMELPSYAKVTNLENGKSIILRINDRGPFYGGRIIDLSYEAARRLGYANKGTARVLVERITMASIADGSWKRGGHALSSEIEAAQAEPPARDPYEQGIESERRGSWSVQIGAFANPDNARAWSAHSQAMMSASGSSLGSTTRIVRSSDGLCRVMLGTYQSREAASAAARSVTQIIGAQAFAAQR